MTRAEMFPNTSKPIIGMLHLPPLPGSYNYTGQPLETSLSTPCARRTSWPAGGFDGVLMQNAGDRPASLEVCPEKVAYMSVIGAAVHRAHPTRPLGVNVCWNVPKATIAVCHAAGGSFIRLEHVYIGMAITHTARYTAVPTRPRSSSSCSMPSTFRFSPMSTKLIAYPSAVCPSSRRRVRPQRLSGTHGDYYGQYLRRVDGDDPGDQEIGAVDAGHSRRWQ